MSAMLISVALLHDKSGRVLLVRKRDTSAFIQPGGKIEDGEGAASALQRELAEELALSVDLKDLSYLGTAHAQAANEPDTMIEAEIFELPCLQPFAVQAEIAEAVWVDPANSTELKLAPLTRDHILPLALKRAAG